MTQQFYRQQQERPAVERRPTVIDNVRISATTIGTAQTIYTVPDGRAFELSKLRISNLSGANVTFSFYAVPPGGSASADNNEITSAIIKANSSDDLRPFLQGFYRPGYTLRMFVGSANNVSVAGYGEEVF